MKFVKLECKDIDLWINAAHIVSLSRQQVTGSFELNLVTGEYYYVSKEWVKANLPELSLD